MKICYGSFVLTLWLLTVSMSLGQSKVNVQEKIAQHKERLVQIKLKEKKIYEELRAYSQKSDSIHEQTVQLNKRNASIAIEIKNKQAQHDKLRHHVFKKQKNIKNILTYIHYFSRPSWMASISIDQKSKSQARYLAKRFVKNELVVLRQYEDDLELLDARKKDLETVVEKQRVILSDMRQREKELSQERLNRKKLLSLITDQKSYYQQSIDELEESKKKMQSMVEQLKVNSKAAHHPFERMMGRLQMPVKGYIEKNYGPYQDSKLGIKLYHKGVDIRARHGLMVSAVFDGVVAYADWFAGYGKVVIIDHGDGFFTMYAHLDELHKKLGESVTISDFIGTVGETDSLKGSYLYFEVRRKGLSEDPKHWLDLKKE